MNIIDLQLMDLHENLDKLGFTLSVTKKAKSTKTTNPTIELIPNIFDPFDAVVIETVIYPIPIFLSSLP